LFISLFLFIYDLAHILIVHFEMILI